MKQDEILTILSNAIEALDDCIDYMDEIKHIDGDLAISHEQLIDVQYNLTYRLENS